MKQNNDEIIRQKTIQLMVATSCAAPVGSDGKVFMLEHNGCGTTNSVKTQDPVTMGGKFIFDQPPDQKLNPGEHFSYEITPGGKTCYFDSDVWNITRWPLVKDLLDSEKWGRPKPGDPEASRWHNGELRVHCLLLVVVEQPAPFVPFFTFPSFQILWHNQCM